MKNKNIMLRTVRRTAAKFYGLSLGVVLTAVCSVILSLVPPLILGRIIDTLTAGTEVSFMLIAGYFVFIALSGITDSLREYFLAVFGQKITHTLRSELSGKLTRLTAEELNAQEPGALSARFVGDVNTIEALFTSGIIGMAVDICKIFSILIVIWTKTKGLALLLAVLLPLVFLFTRAMQKRMLKAQIRNRIAVSRVTNHVPESIRCIRTVHLLKKENYMEKRYDGYISESYRAVEKTNFYDSVYSPIILILNAVTVAVVMLLSASGRPAILHLFGMSVGTCVAIINYIAQIFSPIESLGTEIQTVQSAAAGSKRVNEFLSGPERRKTSADAAEISFPYCVEFQNVTFGYDEQSGKENVLNDISFRIKPGEHILIQGRTGAGKSTIFKLLLGLYRPQSGRVLVNGYDACEIKDSAKRRIFGYVDQSFHMVPGTVKDQITLSDPSITDEMVFRAAKLTGLHETVCALENGYETECDPSLLSQGQWQLLSIARAAAADPQILLLDEITANLDAETEQAVLQALENVSSDRTVISISHRVYKDSSEKKIVLS